MAKQKNPDYSAQLVTGECFASFPHLAEPDQGQYGNNQYKLDAILFHDDDKNTAFKKAIMEHAKTAPSTKGVDPSDLKLPWKDGNTGSVTKYAGYSDHFYISPTTNNAPVVVDVNKKPIPGDAVYGGAVVRVAVVAKAYDINGNKGVKLYLNSVQFVRDSERFGPGGSVPFDDAYSTEDTSDDEGF